VADKFKNLFSPLKLRSVEIKNRIAQPAHGKSFDEHVENFSILSKRDLWYLADRAKGGTGLLIAGEAVVHPTAGGTGGLREIPHAYREEIIPRYKMIANEVHSHGAKIVVQISHVGMMTSGDNQDDFYEVWAPSVLDVPGAYFGKPKAMEIEDIEETIKGFAKSAQNAREGGLDGVEIHGAHSYLIHQFLSPLTNKRTDQYGGDLTNRMRLLLEVVKAVREALGEDLIIGVRIGGDDFIDGGLTLDDAKQIAKALEETNNVDYISVSAGTQFTAKSLSPTIPTYMLPTGLLIPYAAAIKSVLEKTVVLGVGGITTPEFAEKILAEGQADLVGICRGLIADPEFPNKAREGKEDDIRACIRCMQGCATRGANMQPITCIQNPAAGREERLGIGTLKPAQTLKKVVVVGGGPAGLKAAEIASRRKHEVVLYEKESYLGGQIKLASIAPLRQEFVEIVRYLETQVKKLGVMIKTSEEANEDIIRNEQPDAVIIATGCLPKRAIFDKHSFKDLMIPGIDQENVVSIWDVLTSKEKTGKRILLMDGDGHHRNIVTADYLASDSDREVVMVASGQSVIPGRIHPMVAAQMFMRIKAKGIETHLSTTVKEIKGNTVVLVSAGEEKVIEGVDTIIWSTGAIADDSLYFTLKGKFNELYRVGDCVTPRWADYAIWEGEKIGRLI